MIGIPDDEAGELPIAFVVTTNPALTLEDIQAHMGKTLSKYKLVQRVTYVDEIPKSASGKILRRVLKSQVI